MCEILIIAKDTPHPDPVIDTKRYKSGDVVVAMDDGWQWGVEELTNPLFRIVKLPNIPLAEAEAFLGGQKDSDPAHPSRMLQRRAFGIDFSSLPKAVTNWWSDDTRATPILTSNITVAQFRALKKQKAVLSDPAIIGDETPNVL